MLKLNSIPSDVFAVVNDKDVVVNSNGTNISRNEIVSTGRLLTVERVGKIINNRKLNPDKYESRLPEMAWSIKL